MLYDKRWEKPEVKDDPLTIESLIAWLERQPADDFYEYDEPCACMLHQYFTAMGFENVAVGPWDFDHAGATGVMLSDAFHDIASASPGLCTFGAALERARAELARLR
ncbi:hypothetical protein [Bradyrhizobium sp.]|uniref:hypothetical protein n=1 Tax=Bradyrhizobium sp. TaxID=376 RepID=UPI002D39BEC4|nr:hypothetical protein [Bradyrhizobium sp.]HZR75677.1 hypothetical protein [Bradyrhizobium sp.]